MIHVSRVKGGFAAFGKFGAVFQTDKSGKVVNTNLPKNSDKYREMRKRVSAYIKEYYA